MKKYIDFDTGKRKNAINSFEKDFFKLMNNTVYDKTMENLRKRVVKVRLVKNAKDYTKWVNRPSFISQKIFLVQGIKAKISQNLKQIGIKLNLVWLEGHVYGECRVKAPPEDTLGKFFYG